MPPALPSGCCVSTLGAGRRGGGPRRSSGGSGDRTVKRVAAALALLASACTYRFGTLPPNLRLAAPPQVEWAHGSGHAVRLVLENTGTSPLQVAEPSASRAAFEVYATSGNVPLCRKVVTPGGAPRVVTLRARERVTLDVSLPGCVLSPGAYRYEASYDAPPAAGSTWAGRVGPERGELVVRPDAPASNAPAASGAVSSPPDLPPPGGSVPIVPVPLGPGQVAAPAPWDPDVRACLDRELDLRGLNAYGDPPGTLYRGGPPAFASESERERMLFARFPAIATSCQLTTHR